MMLPVGKTDFEIIVNIAEISFTLVLKHKIKKMFVVFISSRELKNSILTRGYAICENTIFKAHEMK
jgi:hypothetical protein